MSNTPSNDKTQPTVLCILDGWGEREDSHANAVAQAQTPNFDRLRARWPHSLLSASGYDVGLPDGQIGNSEVGHLNLGAGRRVLQTLPRITESIATGQMGSRLALTDFVKKAQAGSGTVHLMGLLSDGGVHAHSDHAVFLVRYLKEQGLRVHLHAFADGRDGPAKEIGPKLIEVEAAIGQKAASLIGRYYAMDRDTRWERTQKAFDLIVNAKVDADFGQVKTDDFAASIEASYADGQSDEFLKGAVLPDYSGFAEGDALLAFNFRADRMRQILDAITHGAVFEGFAAELPKLSAALGMVSYSDGLNASMGVLFDRENIEMTLGEAVAGQGMRQIRAAETEKYPHVTYFLNGGRETPFEDEHRLMVPSPKVATYDLQPEMSVPELIEKLLNKMREVQPHLVVVNFANPDMVGHTGDLDAAKAACEAVDNALGQLEALVTESQGKLLVLADHGNCEQMETSDGKPHTAHTLNPVPVIAVGYEGQLRDGGRLADVAPTLLSFLNVPQPEQMDGTSLTLVNQAAS